MSLSSRATSSIGSLDIEPKITRSYKSNTSRGRPSSIIESSSSSSRDSSKPRDKGKGAIYRSNKLLLNSINLRLLETTTLSPKKRDIVSRFITTTTLDPITISTLESSNSNVAPIIITSSIATSSLYSSNRTTKSINLFEDYNISTSTKDSIKELPKDSNSRVRPTINIEEDYIVENFSIINEDNPSILEEDNLDYEEEEEEEEDKEEEYILNIEEDLIPSTIPYDNSRDPYRDVDRDLRGFNIDSTLGVPSSLRSTSRVSSKRAISKVSSYKDREEENSIEETISIIENSKVEDKVLKDTKDSKKNSKRSRGRPKKIKTGNKGRPKKI